MVNKKRLKKISLSNKFIYSLIIFGVAILLVAGVYAAVPNPGHAASEIDFSSGITSQLKVYPSGSNTGPFFFVEQNNGGANYLQIGNYNSGFQPLLLDANPLILQMRSGGNVGIGTTSPNAKLFVQGGSYTQTGNANNAAYAIGATSIAADTSIYSYGKICAGNSLGDCSGTGGTVITSSSVSSGAFLYSSDRNLKTNIQPLQDSLSKVLQLQGVSFNWKATGRSDDGLIAQDVEKVFPELVSTDSAGFKSVEYGNLVGVLVEAIKEQQKEIDSLKTKCG